MEDRAQWLSIGQAAKYLGVSRDSLRRWEKRGKLKAVRSPTNRRYYTKKQLDEIMSGGKGEIKTGKTAKGSTIGGNQKLIIIAIISFVVAIVLFVLAVSLF